RLPYLALLIFAVSLTLAATNWSKRALRSVGNRPVVTLTAVGLGCAVLTAVVSISPTSLHGSEMIANEAGLRNASTYATIALMLPVSWLYWRRFRLGLDIVQASLSIAAIMTAAAVVSMHFGQLWRLSWWDYHGCLLAGFAGTAYAVFTRWRTTRTAATVLESAFDDDPLTHIAQNYPTPLRHLVEAMEDRDSYTHGHSARTAALAVSIGVRMGLDADRLRVLAQGAYLHDIGKLGIPDEILNKPGSLTAEERVIINTHPDLGCQLAAAHEVLTPCLPIIRHHHERLDGAGYPDGLSGQDIPILARIAAVADVWDALTTDRAYRPGWSPQRALDHMVEGAGAHLDPQVLATLLDIASDMGIKPSGLIGDPSAVDAAIEDCHETGESHGDLTPALERQLAEITAAATGPRISA
ncbi:MAG: HD-GYP domain-containing protein, partial [Acidimicrobiales bacterium]|nr:HD-GYP domain-containing protein [Acidimicrobiales bacterium]